MKALTKSLHTITAVKNVAMYLRVSGGGRPHAPADQLVHEALAILGYDMQAFARNDVTIVRCVDAVRTAIATAYAKGE